MSCTCRVECAWVLMHVHAGDSEEICFDRHTIPFASSQHERRAHTRETLRTGSRMANHFFVSVAFSSIIPSSEHARWVLSTFEDTLPVSSTRVTLSILLQTILRMEALLMSWNSMVGMAFALSQTLRMCLFCVHDDDAK